MSHELSNQLTTRALSREQNNNPNELLDRVDFFRLDASRHLNPDRQTALGQFFTPAPTARLMASMFQPTAKPIRLLDAGAGIGSLSAAFVSQSLQWSDRPAELSIDSYEIDPGLTSRLRLTLSGCEIECKQRGIDFFGEIINEILLKTQ